MKTKRFVRVFMQTASLCSLALFVGCASGPRQFAISPVMPAAGPAVTSVDKSVCIREVRDRRIFKINSKEPSEASLSSVDQIDPQRTAGAVAQIRNAFGNVIGELSLKDGKTVRDFIKQAVANAYSRAGYKVVDTASVPNGAAVDVDILDFWAYNTGSWTFTFTAVITTRITAEAPGLAPDPPEFNTTLSLHSAVAASPTSFHNTLTKALEKFTQDLSEKLRPR